MYLEFYGLKENPFNLVSDPRFMYFSESHCDAMAHLLYGVRERKGIILMLGEAGTGKTTLVRTTLEMLQSSRVIPSTILNPILSQTEDFFDAVLRGFGLRGYPRTNVDMADVLQRFLLQQTRRGHIPVLIIDEAQELSRTLLEQVRMLSNLEGDGMKLMQFVLAGQPELAERMEAYEMRALRQRITVRCRLATLTPEDTFSYINSRLVKAGSDGRAIFTDDAVERVFAYSGGIPRVINSIADNCLLAGFARNLKTLEGRVVEKVAQHLELKENTPSPTEAQAIHRDIVRASASWKEVVKDIRAGAVPEALRQFVEKLQVPAESGGRTANMVSAAVQRGE